MTNSRCLTTKVLIEVVQNGIEEDRCLEFESHPVKNYACMKILTKIGFDLQMIKYVSDVVQQEPHNIKIQGNLANMGSYITS